MRKEGERHGRIWLGAVLLAYLVLAAVYSVAVPLAETPDESEHFRYLQHIRLTGRLPIMQPEYEANVTLEAHQPPGLYLLGVALTGWAEQDPADNLEANSCFSFAPDDDGRQHAYFHRAEEWPPQGGVYQAFQFMRWLGILFGLGTVWLAYRLGRQVVSGERRVGLWAAALLAFNPQWIHITASLNNDVPTTFLGAATVYLCIRVAKTGRYRDTAVLGGLLGLGFLTKFALLAFWPLAFLALLWSSLQRSEEASLAENSEIRTWRFGSRSFAIRRSLFFNLLLVTGLPLLIAGWWYWRNFRLYGDPLMWEVTLAAKGAVIARQTPFSLADLGEFWLTHFQSYWLWFGWLTVKAPPWVYGLLLVVVAAAVAGLLRLLWQRHLGVNRPAAGFCLLGVLAVYASLLQYIQSINWTGYQGRLAYAAAAPLAVLLALGLYSLNRRWLGTAVAGGLFCLSVLAVPLLILPAFPRPSIYQPTPSPDLARTCMRFAGGLQVEAVRAPAVVKPGQTLPVTVYGWGLQETAVPQTVNVQLVGRDGAIAGQVAAPLTWAQGEVLSATLSLLIADSSPARGVLEVGLRAESGGWQAATSATGRVLAVPVAVRTVKIAPARPFLPEPEVATAVTFGGQLSLIGYDYDPASQLWTLYWQALAAIEADYTTFLHVLDEDGRLVAQADGQPQAGAYPTSVWSQGEIVADVKQVSIPAAANSEGLRFAVGVYRLETGERLPAYAGTETPLPEDRFVLPPHPD